MGKKKKQIVESDSDSDSDAQPRYHVDRLHEKEEEWVVPVTGRMIPLQSELARTLDSARSGGSAASMRWKKSVAVIRVTRPPPPKATPQETASAYTNLGMTLHHAAAAGDLYAVSALATLSTVNKEDDMGRTPLHLAAAVGETATVRELVKRHGADLQHSTSQGFTALHWAAANGHADTVAALVKLGLAADTHVPRRSFTPLQTATLNDRCEVVRTLLKLGADMEIKDAQGNTALHLAITNRHHATLKELLKAGADVRVCNDETYPPLHVAALVGDVQVIELLVRHSDAVDVAARDPRGNTALHCAVVNGHVVAAQTLVRAGVPMEGSPHARAFPVLHLAALSGHDQMLEALLEMGADVNSLDANRSTALDAAESANQHTTARVLQRRGARRGPGVAGAAPALPPSAHALRD